MEQQPTSGQKNEPPERLLEMLEEALNEAGVGVAVVDASSEEMPIQYASPEIRKLSHGESPETLGRLLSRAEIQEPGGFHLDQLDTHRTKLIASFDVGQTVWKELYVSHQETSFVLVAIDVTQQRMIDQELNRTRAGLEERIHERTAALERTNQDLEGFTYSVSHDLRAPLRAIMGFSKVLVEDHGRDIDNEMRQTLDRINSAAQRMTTIIEDLLTFSRLGRKEMVRKSVNLSEMAQAISSDWSRRHPDRDVRFEYDEGAVAKGDPTLIRLAMENLIDNAYKFTSKREHGLIEFRKLGDHNFVVRDNGAGFDPQYSNKLFRPFERLHSNSEFPGTGIGLANVRRIVERHGGKVWAEGAPDQGASFYFEL